MVGELCRVFGSDGKLMSVAVCLYLPKFREANAGAASCDSTSSPFVNLLWRNGVMKASFEVPAALSSVILTYLCIGVLDWIFKFSGYVIACSNFWLACFAFLGVFRSVSGPTVYWASKVGY